MEQFKDVNRRKSKHKEKLNIAMFGQKRIPSREGGVEIVVEELCSRMVAQGHNVTCYDRGGHHVSGSEYDSKRLKEYKGIRLKTVPTIEKKGLAAVSSSFFAALCCAFGRYDIVHIHAEGPAFFAWLPKLFGKKVIVTIHGLDWQREKWKSGFGSKFIHQGEKNAVKYADEIIVLSKGVQDYFEKEYGRKTVFIPNGVNRPKIQEAELITEKYGLEKDSYILFLGRLVPEKGIRYLVEAFKNPVYLKYMRELFQEHPEYKIVEAHNGALGVYALHAAKVSKIPVRIFHAHGASITKDWKLPIKLVCKACLRSYFFGRISTGRIKSKKKAIYSVLLLRKSTGKYFKSNFLLCKRAWFGGLWRW